MPLAFLLIGILFVIVAVKGNLSAAWTQFDSDLTGSGGFIYWIVAIILLAILGRVLEMPNAAKAFIGLVVVVYVFHQSSNGTIFQQFSSALSSASAPASVATSTQSATTTATPSSSQSNVASSVGSALSSAGSIFSAIGGLF